MGNRQTEIAVRSELPMVNAQPMSVQDLLSQVALIQQVMKAAMKEGEHFGRVPGCGTKPTLLKPGAEKLCMTFRLSPQYHIEDRSLDGEHREFRILVTLLSIGSNANIGQGVGLCSTKEAKYRYRGKAGRTCPHCGKQAIIKGKAEYGGGWVCFKRKDGCGAMFSDGDKSIEDQSEERQENPDVADTYNTVLKMAKKRALVDAILTATAASDIFTQDLEEIMAHEAQMTARTDRREYEVQDLHRPERMRQQPSAVEAELVGDHDSMVPAGPGSQHSAPAGQRVDFRETRIHFGKNRGLMLSELSPQQVHWYETDWMPKKEVAGGGSVEDLALIDALKAYRNWRSDHHSASSQRVAKPATVANSTTVNPEDESQEAVTPFDALKAKADGDKITPDELTDYLRGELDRAKKPLLGEEEEVPDLTDERIVPILAKWDKHRSAILAARKQRHADQVFSPASN